MNIFEHWPRIPRMASECSITEKLDGTNASILIVKMAAETPEFQEQCWEALDQKRGLLIDGMAVFACSRNRHIWPGQDNHSFASWVWENAPELVRILGEGRHFGEWWGRGIQRGYEMPYRVFSVFNTYQYAWLNDEEERERHDVIESLRCVPVLYRGIFSFEALNEAINTLSQEYEDIPVVAEGVVIHFRNNDAPFKIIIGPGGDKRSG